MPFALLFVKLHVETLTAIATFINENLSIYTIEMVYQQMFGTQKLSYSLYTLIRFFWNIKYDNKTINYYKHKMDLEL